MLVVVVDQECKAEAVLDILKAIKTAQNGLISPSHRPVNHKLLKILEIKLERHPEPSLSSQTYRYRPLDADKREIRLLWVEPAEPEEIVECRLYHASLADKPEYIALSYIVGNAKERCLIKLNGVLFEVTTNLDIALRKNRPRNIARPLRPLHQK